MSSSLIRKTRGDVLFKDEFITDVNRDGDTNLDVTYTDNSKKKVSILQVKDVLVQEVSVVDSEGVAHINLSDIPLGREIEVMSNVGGFSRGEVITPDTTLQELWCKLLGTNLFPGETYGGSLLEIPPTEIPTTEFYYYEKRPESIIKYLSSSKERPYMFIAYPSVWGDIKAIYENNFPISILDDSWHKVVINKSDIDYNVWYNDIKLVESNSKYEFKF